MLEGPSEEDEKKIIEKIAQSIVKYGIDQPCLIFFDASNIGWPVSYAIGQWGTMFVGAFVSPFFQDWYKWGFTFQKRKNLEKLIKRVEELRAEKEKAQKERKEQAKMTEKPKKKGWLDHLKL